MEETRKKMNPLRIFCKNCGAPAGARPTAARTAGRFPESRKWNGR